MLKHVCNESTKTKIFNFKNEDVQPNALDLRVKSLHKILSKDENGGLNNHFVLSEDSKIHSKTETIEVNDDGYYFLEPNTYYQVEFWNTIKVGENEAGWTIPRSTLVRNGVMLFSALYDSGYGMNNEKGNPMIAGLYVFNPSGVKIEKNTRIAQYICVDSECKHLYNGSYQ